MKIIMCKRIFLVLLPCLLLLSACSGEGQAENDKAPPAVPPRKVVPIQVQPLAPEDLKETFTLPGTVEAWEDLTLAAELSGPVRSIAPKEGDRMKKGESILRIDPETVQADLARERADFELQKKKLARLETLVEQKLVSQQEYEETRQAFDTAEANLERARVAVEKSTLRAPVDGVLDRLYVDRGEYVSEGDPVAALVQVDRLKVLVEVPEKDVPFLRTGDPVTVVPAAIQGGAGEERPGEIIHLAYRADPATRTYLAKVEIANPEGDLRPGMILRVELSRRSLDQVIAVPLYALIDRNGSKALYVEENGKARMRPVTLGAVIGDRVVITQGLAAGDRLIVEGHQLVTDGTAVSVDPEPGAPISSPQPPTPRPRS